MKDLVEKLSAIEVEEMSIAQRAAVVREIMDYLKVTDEQIEEYGKRGITEETQTEAASGLSSVVGEVAKVAQEEAKVTSVEIEPISFVEQEHQNQSSTNELNPTLEKTFEPEILNSSSNKNDDITNNSAEKTIENKEQSLVTDPQIQQFVIPIILDRINTFGKQDKESQKIVYQGEEYTASFKLEKDTQTLSLDRNSPKLEESQEALLASKDNSSKEYSIIVNNLTQEEFERFKALFQSQSRGQISQLERTSVEQQAYREQSQQQIQNKESGSELD
ncbi:hypothetical protein WA1_51030 [Scytonema hofmannii PCC 7110]|uniref:Uncharacterized protein n=1 Tax=Scytonema hofmannii PCC 7110 TaxID=128403 RepID=A0A139WQ29_9CYAN|nr:hypothetical protein [Scytonema hofmannii]KYC34543.1 hypothetical protein WA1_51030 [Scytonema hofmannii PCC 7110]